LKKKALIEKMNPGEIAKNNLSAEFGDYFKNIVYYDDHNFFDGTHLKKPQEYTAYYTNTYNLMK
jgi:hypothetical protein